MYYYTWTWWWWLAWVIPMAMIIWAIYAWAGGPSGRWSRRRYGYGRDDDWLVGTNPSAYGYRNRGPRNYHRPDVRIFEDVCDRLMLSDAVDATSIEVQVECVVVTLTGSVRTRFERRLAEQIAEYVPGVRDVDNRLGIGKTNVAPARSRQPSDTANPPAPAA